MNLANSHLASGLKDKAGIPYGFLFGAEWLSLGLDWKVWVILYMFRKCPRELDEQWRPFLFFYFFIFYFLFETSNGGLSIHVSRMLCDGIN
jgi:hypothetical protein